MVLNKASNICLGIAYIYQLRANIRNLNILLYNYVQKKVSKENVAY